MLATFFLYAAGLFGLFAVMAGISDYLAEDEGEDLAKIDREIDRLKNGPISLAAESEDMQRERQEYLERLYRVRRRLIGEA